MIRNLLIALCLMGVAHPALAAGRGYLGISFGALPATEETVKTGVIVKKVFAGMAAERAGLKPGEIVTHINGVAAPDPKTAVALLAENPAGERVWMTVIDTSGGGLRRFDVFPTMGDKPTGDFAKIMTAKPPCRLSPLSTARHCLNPAGAQSSPRAVVAKHQANHP